MIEKCRFCAGKGYVDAFVCTACSGSGAVRTRRSLTLHVLQGVTSGSAAKVSLEGIGLKNVILNVEIIVS